MPRTHPPDPRVVDPNNPIEIVKRGFGPEGRGPQQQGGNQWAGLDFALVRVLPGWGWNVLGSLAAAAVIALIVYLFTR